MLMSLLTNVLSAVLSMTTNPHAWVLKDLESVPQNGVKVMSTFACGGGSTMGYKLAGCKVIAANDIDKDMATHYKANHKPEHYFLCPIKELLAADLPSELYGIDILDGSPPCSTFSMAGNREKDWGKEKYFREGQATQVLSDLFFDFLDFAEKLKPKVIIAENVKGMLAGNAKGYTKMIMARLKVMGYRPQLFLVNAADCGVPQKRERVFFCAVRDDIKAPPLALAPRHRWVSVGEATNDLQELTADEIKPNAPNPTDLKYWKATKVGRSYADVALRLTGKGSFFGHCKLDPSTPSTTLLATSHTMHWSTMRKVTLRETIRIGSFPDDYWARSERIGKWLIAMSVPPKMMQVVAQAVVEQWLR